VDGPRSLAGGGLRRGRTALLLLATALFAAGCGGGGSGDLTNKVEPPFGALFHVVDTAGLPVPGATVYLVSTDEIDTAPFTAATVRNGGSEDRDEPLEDAVRLGGGGFPQGVTGPDGMASIAGIPAGRYFPFVTPSPGDSEHLPGGRGCRQSVNAVTLYAQPTTITLSSQPTTAATYVGSSTCVTCHIDYAGHATHAHHLGIAVPGSLSGMQDDGRYP